MQILNEGGRSDLFFGEVVVSQIVRVVRRLKLSTTLVAPPFAGRPAILRTADLIFKIGKVDKLIGLAAQLVSDHRRLRLKRCRRTTAMSR